MIFADWIDQQMQRRHIRSLQVFAREVGVSAMDLGDWVMGAGLPADQDYAQLADACEVDESEIRRLPLKQGKQPLRAARPHLRPHALGAGASLSANFA